MSQELLYCWGVKYVIGAEAIRFQDLEELINVLCCQRLGNCQYVSARLSFQSIELSLFFFYTRSNAGKGTVCHVLTLNDNSTWGFPRFPPAQINTAVTAWRERSQLYGLDTLEQITN